MDSGQAKARMPLAMATEARACLVVAGHRNGMPWSHDSQCSLCIFALPLPQPELPPQLTARTALPLTHSSRPDSLASAPSEAFPSNPSFYQTPLTHHFRSSRPHSPKECLLLALCGPGRLLSEAASCSPGASLHFILGCPCAMPRCAPSKSLGESSLCA